ncbi:MAG TPA: hypothetical protein VFV68_05960 [Agriterribacter sp.]|nr:hypothetical protein [Agriterribacter sp.]
MPAYFLSLLIAITKFARLPEFFGRSAKSAYIYQNLPFWRSPVNEKMLLQKRSKNSNKRKRLAHIVAASVILIHAYEKYENGHSSYPWFGIAGLIFLFIALLHGVVEKKAPWIDGVFFTIEGILSIIIALDYFHLEKKALPYVYLFLAVFQFFMAFWKSKKGIERHKLHQ